MRPALPELSPLILVEVEQPHRHRSGAVADGDEEGAAASETDVRVLDSTARERADSGAQVFDWVDSGAVLVSQGKMEQQVEHRLDPERRELGGGPRPDARSSVTGVDSRDGAAAYPRWTDIRKQRQPARPHPGQTPLTRIPSISTLAPLGSEATPTAARAG